MSIVPSVQIASKILDVGKIESKSGLFSFQYYKCLDTGKFTWPKLDEKKSLVITRAQLSMLIEAIDWRNPVRSSCPSYVA